MRIPHHRAPSPAAHHCLALLALLALVTLLAVPATAQEPPPPPVGPYLTTPELPDFRFKVRITAEGSSIPGTRVFPCIGETLCVAGALPERAELFARIIGPRPNGFLWINLVRFSPSRIEVWAEQLSTGTSNYYLLPALARTTDLLGGRIDKGAFLPSAAASVLEPFGVEPFAHAGAPLHPVTLAPIPSAAEAPRPDATLAAPVTFTPPEFPDYEFTVRIVANGVEQPARREASCLPETVCVSGAIPGRSELFLRIIGPRPNDFFHVNLVRFTPSRVEVDIRRLSTGEERSYVLPAVPRESDALDGRIDREAFFAGDAGPLPPDPGPANDETLEGIDADNDGLRDDVQRYLAFRYPNSPDTIAALSQGARALQAALVASAASESVIDEAETAGRAIECTLAVRPGDGDEVLLDLLAEVLDTNLRVSEYVAYNAALAGQTFGANGPESWIQSCDFVAEDATLRQAQLRALALDQECSIDTDVTVFYVNSVFTTFDKACTEFLTLWSRYHQRYGGDGQTVRFQLVYNANFPVNPVTNAYIDRNFGGSFPDALDFFNTFVPPPGLPIGETLDLYVDAIETVGPTEAFTVDTLMRQVRNELLVGNPAVAVGHSQGNRLIDTAWNQLDPQERQSVGVHAVATIFDSVPGAGPFTNSSSDSVLVAALAPLGVNVFQPAGGFLGHEFLANYMAFGSPSEDKILTDVRTTIDNLTTPDPVASDGIITVTLTWGEQPDLDLHVFEPDGTQVFFGNRTGTVGFLDVDDRNQFGPEHYFGACENLLPGEYRIGVNYFSGLGPETAIVGVEAGLSSRVYGFTLVDPADTSSANPRPVARVLVTETSPGRFDFQILEGW